MKTFRLLALTFLLTTGFGLPSCTDECGCPPVDGTYFSIQEARLENLKFVSGVSMTELAEMDSVQQENYFIRLRFLVNYVSYHEHSPSFSLLNSAYACSCLSNGMNGSKERVESLSFITVNDFNEQYLAGDTINALIAVDAPMQPISIEEFLQKEGKLWEERQFFLLKEKPTANAVLQLKVVLVLDNGKTISATNQAVVIQ